MNSFQFFLEQNPVNYRHCEFHALEYPAAILRGVCTYLAARSGRYEWIQVRDEISQWQCSGSDERGRLRPAAGFSPNGVGQIQMEISELATTSRTTI